MIPVRLSLGAFAPVLRRISADQPTLALTFDDGPSPESTPQVIAALAKVGATATHFLSGVRVERHPELVAALVAAGHDVYAHGWAHDRYRPDQADAAVEATARTEALLARHRPTPATYLVRLPYNAGFTSPAVHRAMRRFHPRVQFAWWSHAIADFDIAIAGGSEAETRAASDQMVAQLAARSDLDGGVLLMHDAPIVEPSTAAAMTTRILVPDLLQSLKRKGLSLIALKPQRRDSALSRFAFRSPQPVTVRHR